MKYFRHSVFAAFPEHIVLASASPRRSELLSRLGVEFSCVPSNAPEEPDLQAPPESLACDLALAKAQNVQERIASGEVEEPADALIIACDTVVSLGGEIFGKPRNRDDARHMLAALSDHTHVVTSGAVLLQGDRMNVFFEQTAVTFFKLYSDDIEDYLDTGEYADKAGAYGIQGYGSLLVARINGDYNNVVGLPVARLAQALKVF